MRSSVLLGSAAILLLTSTAWAGAYAPLPSADKQASGLQVRVVRYTGGTNGEMLVEVKNPTARPVSFSAEGLYFIPEGDPEKAPQRLGAAGPFLVQREGTWKSAQALPLAARTAARLRLQVFCIDSHRASPTAQHAFRLAAQRLPKALRAEIEGGAKRALGQYRAMPAAKSAIQTRL